jgi:hypothetical protein
VTRSTSWLILLVLSSGNGGVNLSSALSGFDCNSQSSIFFTGTTNVTGGSPYGSSVMGFR